MHTSQPSSPAKAGDPVIARPSLLDAPHSRGMTGRETLHLLKSIARQKGEDTMAKDKYIIEPHFRLHEWVAEDKGYFKDEGLDYEFRELVQSSDGASQQLGDKIGAMQTFERGRKSDVSCACHWTVNVAATKGHGKLYGDVYQVSTCGIFVPPDSKVKTPEDLAGVPISVGYQSGSHYATIQALEQFMPHD